MPCEIEPTPSSKRHPIRISLITPTDKAPWDNLYARPVAAFGIRFEPPLITPATSANRK